MTIAPCPIKTTTFFQLLADTPALNGRDNRGKMHSITLVLSGLERVGEFVVLNISDL